MARRGTQFRETMATAERDREIAIYLSDRTHTWTDAEAHFGMVRSSIHEARKRALAAARRDGGDVYVDAHLLEIEALREASWAVLRAHHIHVADGRVIREKDDDGNLITITDHKPVLMAVDRLVRLQEREAKLLGLDAPTKQTVTVLTEDVVDAALREAAAEHARLTAAPAPSTA